MTAHDRTRLNGRLFLRRFAPSSTASKRRRPQVARYARNEKAIKALRAIFNGIEATPGKNAWRALRVR